MFNSDAKAYALARKSFKAFCFLVYPEFECPPHIELLIAECELVLRGKLKRVAAFLPPRHGKSLLIAILFIAYYLGRNPKAQVILATYGASLSEGWGRRIRATIQSENFQRIFPGCVLDPASTAAGRFNFLQGGQFIGTGVDGVATGHGGDLICLDDLIKNESEASSDVVCNGIIEWLKAVIFTRLSKNGAVFMISTRWSERDPGGWIAQQPGWKTIRIPAMSEGKGDLLGRPAGEALWPSHFPSPSLEEIKLRVGARVWQSLYQGNPTAAQGLIFKREWFRRYTVAPEKFSKIVQSWDTAFKANSTSDYSACTTWGKTDSGIYLLHCWRGRVEFPALKRAVGELAEQWRPHEILVEDKASGQSLVQELRTATTYPVIAVKVDADKVTRASSVTGYFEAGKVFFPEGAAWLADFEDELCGFPNAVHDDFTDSCTQALNRLRESGGYGFLDWIKGFIAGKYHEPEKDFSELGTAGNPRNDNLGRAAELQLLGVGRNPTPDAAAVEIHRRADGAVIVSTQALPAVEQNQNIHVHDQVCPTCQSTNCVRLFTNNFECSDCGIRFSRGLVMGQFDRSDLSALREAGATISGPGAPPSALRNHREQYGKYKFGRFG